MRNWLFKKTAILLFFCFFPLFCNAQSGYNIAIEMKNCNDTIAYLTFYQMDKTYIKDTCHKIKNGKIIFKGKEKLENGIYSLVNQSKAIAFDFFIDENTQNLKLKGDSSNFRREATAENAAQENEFFQYTKFLVAQNEKFINTKNQIKGLSKTDSIAKLTAMHKELELNIQEYESQAAEKNKGSYLGDFLNLKREKILKDVPKASNGRPDSLKVYQFYKTHYWDGVDFKDAVITRNPFFYTKLKKYFDAVVYKNPDSVIVEVDRIMRKPDQGTLLYKLLLAHFTATYENYSIMGFEKVFVHMVDAYFKTGKAVGTYEDDVIERIIKRSDKIKPLLLGSLAPNLSMIKITDRDKITKMGFENAKTSAEVTQLYYKNVDEINTLFYKMHDVVADYLIVVFWDVDCGHCQKEIPKLLEEYHNLKKENKDVKVFSVYTQQEGDKYLKYIDEHKLDWINVYDGVFFNNVTEKYDIYSTPVIYVLDKNKIIKAKRIGVEQIKPIIKDIEAEYQKAK
jgi:thiol-disulfide isomerase/thioredoxin